MAAQPKTMDPGEAEEKFLRGLEQFNSGHFFDAHETWEEIWLASTEPEKTFLQGIIQVAAAFHHFSRSNPEGTRLQLEAGLAKLEKCPSTYRGCEIGELREEVKNWIGRLAAGSADAAHARPRIRRSP
jgi:predicted metal-dependent hydrolase